MLKSSILGQEFVNYRKNTDRDTRANFSNKVRSKGMAYVPIVVDSVDSELSLILATRDPNYRRNVKYGLEITLHMDNTVADIIKEIKIEMLKKDKEYTYLVLGLEDGTMPSIDTDLGTLYKKYKNKDDKILYMLLTQEKTMYAYIISIIKYLATNIKTFIVENLKTTTTSSTSYTDINKKKY